MPVTHRRKSVRRKSPRRTLRKKSPVKSVRRKSPRRTLRKKSPVLKSARRSQFQRRSLKVMFTFKFDEDVVEHILSEAQNQSDELFVKIDNILVKENKFDTLYMIPIAFFPSKYQEFLRMYESKEDLNNRMKFILLLSHRRSHLKRRFDTSSTEKQNNQYNFAMEHQPEVIIRAKRNPPLFFS
jgi:hypothetical protein